MKVLKTSVRVISFAGRIVAAAILAVVAVGSVGYVYTPVYDFAAPREFSGGSVFNPYEGADFGSARKAIFHFHTDRSDGKNTLDEVVAAYRSAGYDIVAPADHDRVTVSEEGGLRVYEHGLNAYRFHNLVFGVDRPVRFQLPLWQGVSGREHTLHRLSERFPLVVLNHPGTVRAMSPGQMERLSGYEYIEADRAMERTVPLWDTALSAGHYSFVMAGDDLHDLARWWTFRRAMTFVLAHSLAPDDVMEALQAGHGYAVRVGEPDDFPVLPAVEGVEFSGDTLRVAFSAPAEIRFIGQCGAVRKTTRDAAGAFYVFAPGDTYIRTEARFSAAAFKSDGDAPAGDGPTVDTADSQAAGPGEGVPAAGFENGGATIYLNPLARFSASDGSGRPANADYSTINRPLTVLHSSVHVLLILAAFAGMFFLFRRKKRAAHGRPPHLTR